MVVGLDAGLKGLASRFVPYNGGVGLAQLGWLRHTLTMARIGGEHVVVFGHIPVLPGSCQSNKTVLWNYEEVLAALHEEGRGCVIAYIAGHAHKGGYKVDDFGVHHRTMESPLECPSGVLAFGTVDVYAEPPTLVLRGEGRVPPLLVMAL
jgi:manganese-dependent ADP-ribose/CDP-alcohol diphosphatase